MKSTLGRHPYFVVFLALAVAMEMVLFVTARGTDLHTLQYVGVGAATIGLAALCTWILTWER